MNPAVEPDGAETDAVQLSMAGAELSEEEAAAVVTVISRLAAAETQDNDAGSTGPADRTVQRRHGLERSAHGLWGRPGTDSWKRAAGGLR